MAAEDELSNLKKFVPIMAPAFGKTYVCEQTFSKIRYVKSAYQPRLTDKHMKEDLMAGCRNSKSNIDDSVKAKHKFHKSL